jgi:hypothetical protein
MPTFIAFWNWLPDSLWQTRDFDHRLRCLASVVFTAEIELRMKLDKPAADTWLLVSPEYTFAAPLKKSHGKPAMQTSTANEGKLLAEMKRLTNDYPHLLLAPGTIAVAEQRPMPPHWARNTSHAYSGGNPVWRVDKCQSVGEISTKDAEDNFLQFKSGVGYATAVINNRTYGAEICKDATGAGTLPQMVQRHVVLAAGAAHVTPEPRTSVKNKATELQIIADYANPSVYDYTGDFKKEIKPYGKETLFETTIHYYYVP